MLFYKLDTNISGEKILNDIQNLVSRYKSDSPDNVPILCISIKTISYDDDDMIPKITYQPTSDCST